MSYTNNPTSILAGPGITVTPTTGTGANTVTISADGARPGPLFGRPNYNTNVKE